MARRSSSTLPAAQKNKNDPMLMGYCFGNFFHGDKTPYDFLNNDPMPTDKPGTTYRGSASVSGTRVVDLRNGIEGATIPPKKIWDEGIWWGTIDDDKVPFEPRGKEENDVLDDRAWVVSGEGTPGNYRVAVYVLPEEVALTWKDPKHPALWRKDLKVGEAPPSSFVNSPSVSGHASKPVQSGGWRVVDHRPTPAAAAAAAGVPQPAAAPKLPLGVRFRCAECGHWFKESDLAPHKVCCPGGENTVDGQSSDWAVMCDKECGCEVHFGAHLGEKTLDHCGQCKPGFPRPKEVKMSTTPEPTPEEETTPEAETPEAEGEAETPAAEAETTE